MLIRLAQSASLIIGLCAATPAEACHRFSRWYYPYAQRCSTSSALWSDDASWYVEFILPELDPETQEHNAAVSQHKEELNMLFTAKQAQRDQTHAPIWEYPFKEQDK